MKNKTTKQTVTESNLTISSLNDFVTNWKKSRIIHFMYIRKENSNNFQINGTGKVHHTFCDSTLSINVYTFVWLLSFCHSEYFNLDNKFVISDAGILCIWIFGENYLKVYNLYEFFVTLNTHISKLFITKTMSVMLVVAFSYIGKYMLSIL